jgi:hypothetical protein
MVQCPQCGAENSDGAYYCNKCGTDLTAPGGQQAGGAAAGSQQAGGAEQQHPGKTDRRQPQRRRQQGRGQQQPRGGGPGQPAGASGAGRQKDQSRRNILLGSGAVVAAAAGGWYFFIRDSDSGGGGEEEIRAVIQTQYEAFENGDIDRYMETMHPGSPIYDTTQRQVESTFEQISPESLTVDLTIESIEMLSDERADAKVVQTTRADSADFRDNRIVQVFDMRTYQGEWLVYNSTVNDVEYLE